VSETDTWLIVGLSARPLAQAAAGHRICAIDAFADRDTLAACDGRVIRVALDREWRIDARSLHGALLEARRRFAPAGFTGVVACGGFESSPERLSLLAEAGPLLGSDAATVSAVRDPKRWFSLLDRVDVDHPEVCFDVPTEQNGWLVKSAGGSGGWHIRPWRNNEAIPADAYFQRWAAGLPASALFVANGAVADIVGWQWQLLAPTTRLPWRYGGVIAATDLAPKLRGRVTGLINAIVAETGLRGLCGLDFLIDGDNALALELNARPTASVALYPDLDLFQLHRRACVGIRADIAPKRPTAVTGECILYAPETLDIAGDFRWPTWCRDLPPGRSRPVAGNPVCSVHATGTSSDVVRAQLAHRLHVITNRLKETLPDGSYRRKRERACRTADPGTAG
jgi:uncharacterized protein